MMLLFCLEDDGGRGFGQALAEGLGVPIAAHEDREFEDGERKLRPLVDPRGADVYVLQGTHGGPRHSPHDKLFALLVFAAVLRDHGAARVTAVVPYLAYARKDRRTKPFDPLTLRYVAQLFEAAGIDQVIVFEAHNLAAFENAFRRVTIHVEGHRAFDAAVPDLGGPDALVVASPDPGGIKRVQLWRESLEVRLSRRVGLAMVDKRRSEGVVSSESLVAGDVRGATVMLLDDLIASGETMRSAARTLRDAGAHRVIACAAHGLFVGSAAEALSDDCIAQVLVTDSVPPFRLATGTTPLLNGKLRVVPAAPLIAEAISASRARWLL